MNWSTFADVNVKIDYANMSKMNRIRAWARKNGARVSVERYARDAYSGFVVVHSPWNEGKDVTDRKVVELKELIASK